MRGPPQPGHGPGVNGPMRLKTVQVIAALAAAVAFILAFIAAGIFIVSTLFMVLGLAAIGWLAWSLVQQVRAGDRNRSGQRRAA
jgi:Na+/melibiose symporter-like transporter